MSITKLTIYNKALSDIGAKRLATVTDAVEEQRIITAVYDEIRDEVLTEHAWTFAQKRVALVNMTAPDTDLWATATAYAVDDEVLYGGVYYICLVAHTSDTFSGDLTSLYWETNTDWVTATAYAKGDQVYHTGVSYSCLVAHTSGTFATDLTSVYWIASELPEIDDDGCDNVFYLPTDFLQPNILSDNNAIIKFEETRVLANVNALGMVYTYQLDTPSQYSAQFRIALALKIACEICFSITEDRALAEGLLEKYTKIVLPKAISLDSMRGTPMDQRADAWESARISGAGSGISGNTGDQTWHCR